MSAAMGLKNEFETAVVNEPSFFEPLNFYCNMLVKDRVVRLSMSLAFKVFLTFSLFYKPNPAKKNKKKKTADL